MPRDVGRRAAGAPSAIALLAAVLHLAGCGGVVSSASVHVERGAVSAASSSTSVVAASTEATTAESGAVGDVAATAETTAVGAVAAAVESGAVAGDRSPALAAEAPSGGTSPVDPVLAAVRPDLGGGYVVTGTTAHRLVLFTFDDGPHATNTPRLLDLLDRYGIRAVFFVVPRRLAEETERATELAGVLREIARRGHVVGSHSRDHEILTRISGRELEAQIVGAEELIERAIGGRPWLFRPPGGAHDDEVDAILGERGYSLVLWSVAASDWLTTDADVVFSNFRGVMRNRERHGTPGGVIVLHDTHRWTIDAFPRIVEWILDRNCELLGSREELYDIADDPRLFVVPRAAGAGPSDVSPPIVLPPEVFAERQARARAAAEARCAERS